MYSELDTFITLHIKMETLTKNQEFGRDLAEAFYGSGIKELPFILNIEQAEAFKKRWKELDKQNRKNYGKY